MPELPDMNVGDLASGEPEVIEAIRILLNPIRRKQDDVSLRLAAVEGRMKPATDARPIYLIMCGGAAQTDDNPYGVRWHNNPTWFRDQVQRAFDAGYTRVVFHQITGWQRGDGRLPQQGARVRSGADEFPWEDLLDAKAWGFHRNMTFGLYGSPEFVTPTGFRLADTDTRQDLGCIRNEWSAIMNCDCWEFFYDRGSHPSNQSRIEAWRPLAARYGLRLGTEAIRADSPSPLQLCLDQYLAEKPARLEQHLDRMVPEGHENHVILHAGGLTLGEIEQLEANGYTIGRSSVWTGA